MLELYRPKVEDLWFREKILGDEETMSFNKPWGGTIPFPESAWKQWHDTWTLCDDGKRFYRYLKDPDSEEFVGEIFYCFDDDRWIWLASILIAAGHRGKGYGRQALKILCELAAETGIEILYDDAALEDPSIPLFTENGFREEYRTDDIVLLKKDLRKNQMTITEEYDDLMDYNNLPERFRAGDFGIFEDEEAILREFVDNFYETARRNGYVDLWDFTELMAFIDICRDADTDTVQNILVKAFIESAKIQNALLKRQFPDREEIIQ